MDENKKVKEYTKRFQVLLQDSMDELDFDDFNVLLGKLALTLENADVFHNGLKE